MNIACKIEEDKTQRYCNFNQVWYGPMFQKKDTCSTVLSWQVLVKKIKLGWSQNYRLAWDFIQLFWLSLLTGRVASRSLTEPYLTCYHSTWLWPWHLDKTWFKVTIHLLPTCIFYLTFDLEIKFQVHFSPLFSSNFGVTFFNQDGHKG